MSVDDQAAKTRRQLQGIDDPPSLGVAPPCAEEEGYRELGQTETWPRIIEYRHPKHFLTDLMTPGYFRDEVRTRMHPGDEIHTSICDTMRSKYSSSKFVCSAFC